MECIKAAPQNEQIAKTVSHTSHRIPLNLESRPVASCVLLRMGMEVFQAFGKHFLLQGLLQGSRGLFRISSANSALRRVLARVSNLTDLL